jgi:hypothetical protein
MQTHRTIVITFVTLDGIMQDPDGAERTPNGGWAFRHGPEAVAGDKFRLGALFNTGVWFTRSRGKTSWTSTESSSSRRSWAAAHACSKRGRHRATCASRPSRRAAPRPCCGTSDLRPEVVAAFEPSSPARAPAVNRTASATLRSCGAYSEARSKRAPGPSSAWTPQLRAR